MQKIMNKTTNTNVMTDEQVQGRKKAKRKDTAKIRIHDIDATGDGCNLVRSGDVWERAAYYPSTIVVELSAKGHALQIQLQPTIDIDGDLADWSRGDSEDDLVLREIRDDHFRGDALDETIPRDVVSVFYSYDDFEDVWRLKEDVRDKIEMLINKEFKSYLKRCGVL